jgi:hypothetical protein
MRRRIHACQLRAARKDLAHVLQRAQERVEDYFIALDVQLASCFCLCQRRLALWGVPPLTQKQNDTNSHTLGAL